MTSELAKYLNGIMKERNLSVRAVAADAGLAHGTIQNILAGKPVDHKTVQKLASYLNMPVDVLYRMAGVLPPEEEQREEILRMIEYLMRKLPESDQQEILEIVRMKVSRQIKAEEDKSNAA